MMFFVNENEEEKLFQKLLKLVQDSTFPSKNSNLPHILEQLRLRLKEYQNIPMSKADYQIALNTLARWASSNPQPEIVNVLEAFGANYKEANRLTYSNK